MESIHELFMSYIHKVVRRGIIPREPRQHAMTVEKSGQVPQDCLSGC